MDLTLVGTVYLRRLDGTRIPVPGCTVRHSYQNCCEEQKGQQPMDTNVSGDDGSYAIRITSRPRRYTHTIRCDYAGAIAATRQYQAPDIAFNPASMQAEYDFIFVEAEQALISHPCRGVCSTKDTPCGRNTTNKEHCYQHIDQDTGKA
jgi:hypothetical protein